MLDLRSQLTMNFIILKEEAYLRENSIARVFFFNLTFHIFQLCDIILQCSILRCTVSGFYSSKSTVFLVDLVKAKKRWIILGSQIIKLSIIDTMSTRKSQEEKALVVMKQSHLMYMQLTSCKRT